MPVIHQNGLVVDYLDEGSGPPVLLAHSSVSGNRQWKRLIELLKPRYRVLAPNLFGYGQTTPWTVDGTQTLRDAADVLLAIADGLDGPLRLIGHSWGGGVALRAASVLGEQVSHLAVFEPMVPFLLKAHGRTEAAAEARALRDDVKRFGAERAWEALAARFTDFFNGDGAWAAMPEERRRIVAAQIQPNYYEWDSIDEPHTADLFATVSARTLLMRCAAGRLVTHETVEVLRETYPRWSFVEVAEGGHMAPLARPDLVNPVLAGFLDAA